MRLETPVRPRRWEGFSLLELMLVAAVLVVLAAMAVPNVVNTVSNIRLRKSMNSLSGLFQDCRATAVKQNKIMTVHFGVVAAGGGMAYVKDAGSGAGVVPADPQVLLGRPVSKIASPSGPGAPTPLDSTILNFTALTIDPSFNPRGLPCSYSSGSCTSNVGFAYYFTDARPLGKNGWAAVSISPAGRIKVWYWSGSAWSD